MNKIIAEWCELELIASTVNPYGYLLALSVPCSNFAVVAGPQTAQIYRLEICCNCCCCCCCYCCCCCLYEVDNYGLFCQFL